MTKQKKKYKNLIMDGTVEAQYYMETKSGAPCFLEISRVEDTGFINGAIYSDLSIVVYAENKTLKNIKYTLLKKGIITLNKPTIDYPYGYEEFSDFIGSGFEYRWRLICSYNGFKNIKKNILLNFKETTDPDILLLKELQD